MIKRLRPAMSTVETAQAYAHLHNHRLYGRGHAERVAKMIEFGQSRLWKNAADLSCGNAAVMNSLTVYGESYLGDLSPGYPITGPVEQTIDEIPNVELFISGETLEHLNMPALMLEQAAEKAQWLLLSTPIDAWDDTNREHYWAWDRDGVEVMLTDAGWLCHHQYAEVDSTAYGEPYRYGIWLVSREQEDHAC